MQNTLDVRRLSPLGTHVLVKRGPVETNFSGELSRLIIPEDARDRNGLKGQLYTGTVISVGERTKSAKYGRAVAWFEPGDRVWFFAMWDWKDHEVVLKDSETGDEYLVVDESQIKTF